MQVFSLSVLISTDLLDLVGKLTRSWMSWKDLTNQIHENLKLVKERHSLILPWKIFGLSSAWVLDTRESKPQNLPGCQIS